MNPFWLGLRWRAPSIVVPHGPQNLDERRGGSRLTGPQLDEVRRSSDESGITVQGRHDGYKEKYGLWHRRYIFVDHEDPMGKTETASWRSVITSLGIASVSTATAMRVGL